MKHKAFLTILCSTEDNGVDCEESLIENGSCKYIQWKGLTLTKFCYKASLEKELIIEAGERFT